MKIAAITITYNDDYKFKEWCQHYEEYRNEIDIHIIVDNGSERGYLRQVKDYFKDSIIIERRDNGGCTGAYNDGIKLALADKNVDAIALIGNDIKLLSGDCSKLYDFLYSNSEFGMVAPVILKKDSNIVEDFGSKISPYLTMQPLNYGEPIQDVSDIYHIVESVAGGMNLSTREFYEKVGLQDENLFMYSDEVDMGLRAQKGGFKLAVTKTAVCWHQHINSPGDAVRKPYVSYLMARNKVYLAKKNGLIFSLRVIAYHFVVFFGGYTKRIYSKEMRRYFYYYLRGILDGIRGNMHSKLFFKLIG